jgi:hypothetical protein
MSRRQRAMRGLLLLLFIGAIVGLSLGYRMGISGRDRQTGSPGGSSTASSGGYS